MSAEEPLPDRAPFWSDDFDMDLLRVLPEVERWCAKAARPLYVHGGTTKGRLNSPTAWNHDLGFACFFFLNPACPEKPEHFWTDSQIVECTLLEVLRDLWVHGCYAFLGALPFWDSQALKDHFDALMYHGRGWKPLPEKEVRAHLDAVRISILLTIQQPIPTRPPERRDSPSENHSSRGSELQAHRARPD